MKLINKLLPNGLKLLLIKSQKSPVVSVQMWVRTGSADEPKGLEGISHFIEHLVFKGTQSFGVGEIAQSVEAHGGELNAYTSFDQTVFYITIAAEHWPLALRITTEMMSVPLFDPTEIDNEREVVIEEIKRSLDSPQRQSVQELFRINYHRHPYSIPVIGYEKNIRKWSAATIRSYFEEHYRPSQMTLVTAGDFDPKALEQKLKVLPVGQLGLKPRLKQKRPRLILGEKPKIAVVTKDFHETLVKVAFPIPKPDGKDVPALEMLAMLLGQGDASRLSMAMRLSRPLCNYAVSSLYNPLAEGLFIISLSLNPEHLAEALDTLKDEMVRLIFEPCAEFELERCRVNLASEDFYSMETVDGLSRKYGHYEFLFNDPLYHDEFIKQTMKLTAADLKRVAKRYLRPDRVRVSILGRSPTESTKKLVQSWLRSFAKALNPKKNQKQLIPAHDRTRASRRFRLPKKVNSPMRIDHEQLTNGLNVLLIARPDSPVISGRLLFQGGARYESSQQAGLSELMSRVWPTGTQNRSEAKLNLEIESLAASLNTFSGRNSCGLNFTVLSSMVSELTPLIKDMALNPLFSNDQFERERIIQIEQIKSQKDNPTQVCVQQFMRLMYGNHPYGRDTLGSVESVTQLTNADLNRHYQRVFSARGSWFVVCGPHDAIQREHSEWLQFLKQIPVQTDIPNVKMSETNLASKFEFMELKREQSHLIVGYPGLTFTDPNRYSLQIMQAVLAGQGGRLFLELRDKASLAYSVSPLRMEGIDSGYFGAYIGCSPEKVSRAYTMMQVEFRKLVETALSSTELDRAKTFLKGKHAIESQRNSQFATHLAFEVLYGNSLAEAQSYNQKIDQVTATDIQKVAQSIFSKKPVISLVGPQLPTSFKELTHDL